MKKMLASLMVILCAALAACGACAQGSGEAQDALGSYLIDVYIPECGLAQAGECDSLDDMRGFVDGTIEDLDGDGEAELLAVRTDIEGEDFLIYMEVYSLSPSEGVRLRAREQWRSAQFGRDPWDTRMGLCTFTLDGARCIGLYTYLCMNDSTESFHVYRLEGDELSYVEGVYAINHYNSAQLFTTRERSEGGAIFDYMNLPNWELSAGGYAEGDEEPTDEEYRAQFEEVMTAYDEWLERMELSRVDWSLLDFMETDFTTRDKLLPEDLITGSELTWVCHLSSARGFDTQSYRLLDVGALSGLGDR